MSLFAGKLWERTNKQHSHLFSKKDISHDNLFKM